MTLKTKSTGGGANKKKVNLPCKLRESQKLEVPTEDITFEGRNKGRTEDRRDL